jgi:hypothetical protein
MHAYKDAIRRTGGAYVLYPGTEKHEPISGFHEIIPGLGAFAVRPNEGDNGTVELSQFIDEIIAHFNNMASQQRRHSNTIYEIHKDGTPNIVNEPIPYDIIPDETHVIVAYYESPEHLAWINKQLKFNARIFNDNAGMNLSSAFIGANYLILKGKHQHELLIYDIKQSKNDKPYVIPSDHDLFKPNEPKSFDLTQPFYLIFNLEVNKNYFLKSVNKDKIKQLTDNLDENEAFLFTCKLSDLLSPPK